MSVIIVPRRQILTSPVDSDSEIDMLLVLAVIPAAAACRVPRP